MSAEGKWTAGMSEEVKAARQAIAQAIYDATNVDRDWTMEPELSRVAERFIDGLDDAGFRIIDSDALTASEALVADMAEALREAEAALSGLVELAKLRGGHLHEYSAAVAGAEAALTRARAALAKGGA